MARAERNNHDLFEAARRVLREKGLEAGVEQAAKILRKIKDPVAAAEALAASWRENENLLRLQETGRSLTTELDLDKLLNAIMDAAIEVVGAERGFQMLAGADGSLAIGVARNMEGDEVDEGERKISRSVAERAFTGGEAILTTNAEEDDRFSASQSIAEYQLRSILCVPLKTKQGIIGVLYMDNRSIKGMFDEGHRRLLELFAGQAAVALENARLHGELLASKKRQEVELVQVKRVLDESRRDLGLKYKYDRIIGTSPKMQEIFRLLDRTTDTTVPVLIVGESGTGKELVAKAIHYNGPRKRANFVAENVSAISESLLESELFGHVRGSFTGALGDKQGLFEVADGGTLFLDEIGDMSKSMQAKLLRALQEGEIRRVGGKSTIKVDVRIISATNRDLEEMIESGDFRQDLFYRLNVIKVSLPPLRDRREDIGLLVTHFLETMARDGQERQLSNETLALLVSYDWPGNVRELENEIARAVVLSDDWITPEVLSDRIRQQAPSVAAAVLPVGDRPLKEVVEQIERQIITRKLEETGGNKSATAKELGLSRDGLRKKLIRYGLDSGGG